MAVTPDNSTLIVAESFAAPADGVRHRRPTAASRTGASGPSSATGPDGICIDADGAVWYADVPNMRCVRVREGGEVLQTIELDRGCFACMLGGQDRRTLFMVAAEWHGPANMIDGPRTGRLLTAPAPAPGAGWP